MDAIHCTVSGKVQGVYFRAWTRDAARRIGLSGWVRNLPDGRVEAVAAGSAEQLDAFKRALQEGSPLSRVSAVDCEAADPNGLPDPFEVRY